MKIRYEVTINADRDTVWREFDDPGNLREWQPTLKSLRQKSGSPGEPGAVCELIYDEDGRDMVMTETMTEKREPDFMAGFYDSPRSNAIIVNHFEPVGNGQTRWTIHANYQLKGLNKFLGILRRKAIRAQTDDAMQRFKLLVETRAAGASS